VDHRVSGRAFLFHFNHGSAGALDRGSIVAEDPQKYYAYRTINGDDFPLFSGDVVLSEYILNEVDGGTEVTFVEQLERLRLIAIPMLFWMNPCRDALIRLKATCEGEEDTSWMGKSADKIRQDEADRTISTYSFLKWVALAFIPIAFTLAMISFIGHSTAP